MTDTQKLTLRALNRATLARQMLLVREKISPLRAIERLAGLQAQWPKHPFVALWSRVQGFEREALLGALNDHDVVRATLMRGTLHLVSAKDYVNWRPMVQPLLTRSMKSVLKDRAKDFDLERICVAARKCFAKRPQTFTELRAALSSLDPNGDERALGFAVRTHLPLVQVPIDAPWGFAADSDFALADAWIGEPIATKEVSPDAMLLRYLAAFGPASIADMQAWSGLQGLRAVVTQLRPKLVTFSDDEGRELFDLAKAPRPDEDTPAPARFVAEYDNMIIGRSDERFVAAAHRPKIFLSALRVRATFLVDGFVAGTWLVKRKKHEATLVIEPFKALPKKARDALCEEAEPLVRFMEPDAKTHAIAVSD